MAQIEGECGMVDQHVHNLIGMVMCIFLYIFKMIIGNRLVPDHWG